MKNDIERKNYKQLFENNFDFDESSKQWTENKISIGNGSYIYKKRSLNAWKPPSIKQSKKKSKPKINK